MMRSLRLEWPHILLRRNMSTERLILISGAEVFAPEHLGKRDLLISGHRIIAMEEKLETGRLTAPEVLHLDARGKILVPGLIDGHVHIAGAGGEGGPATRTPELQLGQLLRGGVTSVVGCLGTDGVTRTPESVLMKVKALRAEGVSAWMFTGAYQVPTPTITGTIAGDLSLIEEVIGVGEIALSDHRSSFPTTPELIHLASEARVGGMLGGKKGIVNIHMGDARDPFRPILEAVEQSELILNQFLPTHCNRNHHIFEDAKRYGREGYVDLTTSSYPFFPEYEIKPSVALKELLEAGLDPANITMTSDANGSLPHFDEQGRLVRLEMGQPDSMLRELRDAILEESIPPETALRPFTSSPAAILGLESKGRIGACRDADLLLLTRDWQLSGVFALGKELVKDGELQKKGSYED